MPALQRKSENEENKSFIGLATGLKQKSAKKC